MQSISSQYDIRRAFLVFILLALLGFGSKVQAACTSNPDVVKLHPALAKSECKLVGTSTFKNVLIETYQDTLMPEASAKLFRAAIAEASIKSMASFSSLKPGIEFHAIEFVITPKAKIGGITGVPKVMGVSNSEMCIITLNGDINSLKMEGGGKASDFPSLFGETYKNTVAHEIAHCFQSWNFPQQMQAGSTQWWDEGTAMYLAGTLYPFATPSQAKVVKQFDKLSATTPLTKLDYHTYVFFAWLGQKRGPKAMFDFMAAMPKVAGETAQRNALLSYISAKELQQFAYDYVDGRIKGPKLDVIGKPDMGPMQLISGDVQKKFIGKPFTIMRGQFTIKDGDYTVKTVSSTSPEPAYSRTAFQWGEMDKKVEASCSSPLAYQYAAFVTDGKDITETLTADLTKENKDCKACVNLGQRDKCVIGRWIMDDESLASFLKLAWDNQTGPLITGDAIFEFLDNGQMKLTFKKLKIVVFYQLTQSTVIANGIQSGKWSSSSGQLRSCPVSNTVMLDTTIRVFSPVDVTSKVMIPGQAETTDFQFQCKGNTMTLSHQDAKVKGKMVVWHLSRESNQAGD